MDKILPVSEVRSKLPSLIKKLNKEGGRLVITKNGRAEAVLMSPEMLETLEIMSDKKLLRDIAAAKEDIKKGRLYSHKEVFGNV